MSDGAELAALAEAAEVAALAEAAEVSALAAASEEAVLAEASELAVLAEADGSVRRLFVVWASSASGIDAIASGSPDLRLCSVPLAARTVRGSVSRSKQHNRNVCFVRTCVLRPSMVGVKAHVLLQ